MLDVEDPLADPRAKARAKHRASQYMIENGKLWRLGSTTATRGRSRLECITRSEAVERARYTHAHEGHWGRDAVKLSLIDRVWSPKLDASTLEGIRHCPKCKNFGGSNLHALLNPITRRHPMELLVGDYLKISTGKGGYNMLGVYLDTFSQHVWVFKYKSAGSGKTTVEALKSIFQGFTPPETFMSDGGKHFDNAEVREFCRKWNVNTHIIAAYAPWVNGLVEGANKLLLKVLKRLCAPDLGEDDAEDVDWDTLPRTWPDHLDEAVKCLNYRILSALKFSPKELLLGLVVNTPPTPASIAITETTEDDAMVHVKYVAQQHLDAYDETVRHAKRRKALFDRKLRKSRTGSVTFIPGSLVQVYRSDLDYTFIAEKKLLPKWSRPYRVVRKVMNSYELETLQGEEIGGRFHARRLREFIPRPGTKLALDESRKRRLRTLKVTST